MQAIQARMIVIKIFFILGVSCDMNLALENGFCG